SDDRRRLPLHDAEVVLPSRGKLETARILQHLALDEVGARLAASQDDRLRVFGGQFERPDEEVVPAHDRERDPEGSGYRGPSAAGLGVVDDVVVHERRGMDQLERGGEGVDRPGLGRPQRAERGGHEERSDPLPSHRHGVPGGLRERRVARAEDLVQAPIDVREVPDEHREQRRELRRGLHAQRLRHERFERRLERVAGSRRRHEFPRRREGQRSRIIESRPDTPIYRMPRARSRSGRANRSPYCWIRAARSSGTYSAFRQAVSYSVRGEPSRTWRAAAFPASQPLSIAVGMPPPFVAMTRFAASPAKSARPRTRLSGGGPTGTHQAVFCRPGPRPCSERNRSSRPPSDLPEGSWAAPRPTFAWRRTPPEASTMSSCTPVTPSGNRSSAPAPSARKASALSNARRETVQPASGNRKTWPNGEMQAIRCVSRSTVDAGTSKASATSSEQPKMSESSC